jgi:aryl-alcohol dehydrogenase-like predicted oxidoreductase
VKSPPRKGDAMSLPRLGLGTHGLHWLPTRERQSLLALAFELGIRYLDTAPSYGEGLAEREIGRFAAKRREQLVIATKFGMPVNRTLSRVPGLLLAARAGGAIARKLGVASAPRRNYGAAAARASVEQSLRALRTTYLDVLYLHEPELSLLQDRDVAALVDTLETLRTLGIVRHFGLSGSLASCTAIAQAHPALAGLLQIEVPADAQGLPAAAAPFPAAAVRFWEFPKAGDHPADLSLVMHRLSQVAPHGTILLSTRDAAQLKEAARLLLDCSTLRA